jgi:hypothetical protein
MKTLSLTLAILFTSMASLAGDDTDLAGMPGYVDFGELAADYGEPRVMVDIGSSLLKLVSAMKHDDPVAEAALSNLESVRVHVYDTVGDIAAAAQRMQDVSDMLGDLDWEQIVKVREEGKKVDVYVKYTNEEIHGLTVMKVDNEEAVFVNVLGDINPGELSMVIDHVDADMDMDL